MTSENKLALVRGALQKLHIHGVILTARRAIEGTLDRLQPIPLRDIDNWSDQAEVAFYEDQHCRRA